MPKKKKNVGIRWAKTIQFLSAVSLTYTDRDKLITADIQPGEICFFPLLTVSHFLKTWQTVGNKSDNDHRGIPPQGQEQKCERETEKSRNYFFIPGGKRKSHMKAKKKKNVSIPNIFLYYPGLLPVYKKAHLWVSTTNSFWRVKEIYQNWN